MMSPNVEVQCNAVGCITNLATHEDNKAKIARSGALGPLTRLAKSKDMRVQRNATGALLNMTHSGKHFHVPTFEQITNLEKTKIGSNLSMRVPFPCLSNFFPLPMSMFNTIAQPPLAILLSMPTTERNLPRMKIVLFSLWST